MNGLTNEMHASKLAENLKEKTTFDIDIRSVLAMREINRRYSSTEKLCRFENSFTTNASRWTQ